MSAQMFSIISGALGQTLLMVFIPCIFGVVFGVPLGVLLYLWRKNGLLPKPKILKVTDFFVNIVRSFPFIILMIALIPLTRLLIGTTVGTAAAIVPLSIAAIAFLARLSANAFLEIPSELLETALSMGATTLQIIKKVILPESLASLVRAITMTTVILIGYSSMAGAVGGGGLGDVAIRYGYQRFDTNTMFVTVLILILLVTVLQKVGDLIADKLQH